MKTEGVARPAHLHSQGRARSLVRSRGCCSRVPCSLDVALANLASGNLSDGGGEGDSQPFDSLEAAQRERPTNYKELNYRGFHIHKHKALNHVSSPPLTLDPISSASGPVAPGHLLPFKLQDICGHCPLLSSQCPAPHKVSRPQPCNSTHHALFVPLHI